MLLVILVAGLSKRFTGRENAITRWIARKGSRIHSKRGI